MLLCSQERTHLPARRGHASIPARRGHTSILAGRGHASILAGRGHFSILAGRGPLSWPGEDTSILAGRGHTSIPARRGHTSLHPGWEGIHLDPVSTQERTSHSLTIWLRRFEARSLTVRKMKKINGIRVFNVVLV